MQRSTRSLCSSSPLHYSASTRCSSTSTLHCIPSVFGSSVRASERSLYTPSKQANKLANASSLFSSQKASRFNLLVAATSSGQWMSVRERMTLITEVKKGDFIVFHNRTYEVLRRDQPRGYGRGTMNVSFEVRDVVNGTKKEEKLKAVMSVDVLEIILRLSKFDRIEGKKAYLFDTETNEEFSIPIEKLADKAPWLNKGSRLVVKESDGNVLWVQFPTKAKHVVEQTETVQGTQSAKMGYKTAKLKNGKSVKLPYYIEQGETVWISLEDFAYRERAEQGKDDEDDEENEEDEEEDEEEEEEEDKEEEKPKPKKK